MRMGYPTWSPLASSPVKFRGSYPGWYLVLWGQGDGTFVLVQEITVGIGAFGLAAGHLNDDQFLDVVTANSQGNDLSVLLGQGDGRFGGRPDDPG